MGPCHRVHPGRAQRLSLIHILDRVIGQHAADDTGHSGMRQGVRLESILDALENPIGIGKIVYTDDRGGSYVVYGRSCSVSINPINGYLIQVSPQHF